MRRLGCSRHRPLSIYALPFRSSCSPDYTVASYTIYATSAVAAQSLLRELLSGALSLVTEQMYEGLGYQWASTLLVSRRHICVTILDDACVADPSDAFHSVQAFLGVGLAPIPFVLYYFGPAIRKRSSFYEEVQAVSRTRPSSICWSQAHEADRLSLFRYIPILQAEREARHREAELEEEFSRENTIATRATAGWNRTMTTNGTRTRGAYAGRGGAIEGDEEKQERPHQQENHVPLDDVPEETAMSPAQKLQEAEAHGKYEEEREKAAQDKNNSGAGRD